MAVQSARMVLFANQIKMSLNNKYSYHTSIILYKRSLKETEPKPKPEGEALTVHMKLKADGIARYSMYKQAVNEIVQVFKSEKRSNEEKRLSSEGEFRKSLEKDKEALIERLSIVGKNNEELKLRRIEREAEEKKLKEEKESTHERLAQEELQKLFESRQAMVANAVADSDGFVTLDNLDRRIEECLIHETNYNFALTRDGEVIPSIRPPGNYEGHEPGTAAFKLGGQRFNSAQETQKA